MRHNHSFRTSLSGLLTARFILHLLKLKHGHITIQGSRFSVSNSSLVDDSPVTPRQIVPNIMDDFGEDPVAKAQYHRALRTQFSMRRREEVHVYPVDLRTTTTVRESSIHIDDPSIPCDSCDRCLEGRESEERKSEEVEIVYAAWILQFRDGLGLVLMVVYVVSTVASTYVYNSWTFMLVQTRSSSFGSRWFW